MVYFVSAILIMLLDTWILVFAPEMFKSVCTQPWGAYVRSRLVNIVHKMKRFVQHNVLAFHDCMRRKKDKACLL